MGWRNDTTSRSIQIFRLGRGGDWLCGLCVCDGMNTSNQWQEKGTQKASLDQRNLFNAACGDLAAQISWHGFKLSKDDWRHMLSGTVLGWRMMPAVDRGEGAAGLIMLGGSSLDLSKDQCTDAITQAFLIGDDPSSQGLKSSPVRWCKSVCGARWITDEVMA